MLTTPPTSRINAERRGACNASNQTFGVTTILAQTCTSQDATHDCNLHPNKRRKTTGGSRVGQTSCLDTPPDDRVVPVLVEGNSTARQLQTKSREFPQRKKQNGEGAPQLQPSSVEKFVAGVWKQMFSSIELGTNSLVNLLLIRNVLLSDPADRL